ncbi:hypothetical protein [Burkholderia pseudomultivorans]|uniref:hypothetical protein n=1 Tax=Burkholderia pseudomultivorans TaxID=1207504 RepID=UPI0008415357|nr:hypothetical protein [Burkholderia pseudomultivorans]AOI92086.1 hypothetical protein WS57_25580 [Burkholderia pseudomultivorans]
MKFAICAFAMLIANTASAECVVSQSTATHVQVIDSGTLLIYGGAAGHTMMRSLTPLLPGGQFAIGKDSFCDFDSSALFMNGQPILIQEIRHLY